MLTYIAKIIKNGPKNSDEKISRNRILRRNLEFSLVHLEGKRWKKNGFIDSYSPVSAGVTLKAVIFNDGKVQKEKSNRNCPYKKKNDVCDTSRHNQQDVQWFCDAYVVIHSHK